MNTAAVSPAIHNRIFYIFSKTQHVTKHRGARRGVCAAPAAAHRGELLFGRLIRGVGAAASSGCLGVQGFFNGCPGEQAFAEKVDF